MLQTISISSQIMIQLLKFTWEILVFLILEIMMDLTSRLQNS
jgi:hypothetical protein